MMMLKFLTDVPFLNCFIYHLELYNLVHHPDKKDCARCTVGRCKSDVKIANGTGGLSSHMRYKHRKEYDKYKDKEIEMSTLTTLRRRRSRASLVQATNSVAATTRSCTRPRQYFGRLNKVFLSLRLISRLSAPC